MPRKAYLHYEQAGAFTLAVTVDESSSVSSILDTFASALGKANGTAYNASMFVLKSSEGKVLSERKKYDFLELLEDCNDLTVIDANVPAPPAPASVAPPKPPVPAEPVCTLSETDLKDAKDRIKELFDKRQYKKARVAAEEMQAKVLPKGEVSFLSTLANVAFATKKYSRCIDLCKRAMQQNPQMLDNQYLLARAYFADKQFFEAREAVEELKGLVPTSVTKKSRFTLKNGLTYTVSCSYVDILALEAEAVFEDGNPNGGANLINAAMAYPKADSNLGVLLAYASFSLRYNKTEEAVRSMLKAITVSQTDKRVRFLLSEVLKTPQGIQELQSQLPVSAASASAFAFLGTVVKDHSAIQSSIALYRLAMQGLPSSGSYALNLLHSIEVTYRFDDIISEFLLFARKVSSFPQGSNKLYPLIEAVREILESHPGMSLGALPVSSGQTLTWVVDKKNDHNSHAWAQTAALPGEEDVIDAANEDIDLKSVKKHRYSDAELELLSMCYTVTKVLYVQGKLAVLPALFQAIEPVRVQSITPLHETIMRNENAYYSSIMQIMCVNSSKTTPPSPVVSLPRAALTGGSAGFEKPIFVCGDSHTLSPSWSKINVKGKERLLVPRLVTGIKQWHLRAESTFYPKANFQYAMDAIPEGSEVLLIIGEIDCREGMLLACERDCYDSLPQAMEHTVKLFVKDVLKALVARKKLKFYIHPIVSVLNETRHLAIAYNSIYKAATANIPGVTWLDIFEDMLDFSGPSPLLKNRYALDGTHLNPVYVELLERSLNQV